MMQEEQELQKQSENTEEKQNDRRIYSLHGAIPKTSFPYNVILPDPGCP